MLADPQRWILSAASDLAVAILGRDPWAGFRAPERTPDLQGWGSDDPVFGVLIEELRPKLILEIGSWKGASAVTMADHCDRLGLNTTIVCVDTWLGSREMLGDQSQVPQRDVQRTHGWPMVYHTFLANVAARGHAGRVVPFPATSRIALRWLRERGVTADLVYVDASHDYQDVLDDAMGAWSLLRPGGALLGDDYGPSWPEVPQAVNALAATLTVEVQVTGNKWLVRR